MRSNEEIAGILDEVAELLRAQEANPFKIKAWEAGAREVRGQKEPVARILDREGRAGLKALPHIGDSISAAIDEIVHTGGLGMLNRLRGAVSPEDLFCTLPGIGEELAARIHQELDIDTLEELELAAHDGRLEAVDGVGPRRAEAIRDLLATRLSRSTRRRSRRVEHAHPPLEDPPVELLLEVDRLYRDKAGKGQLRTITPRRFNPEHKSWLPVMHLERQGWDLTAMYSNTAQAHRLGRNRDWVVIYYERSGEEGQCTVVTAQHGPLAGRRVVRGREREMSAA